MKKISKYLLIVLLGFTLIGSGCSNDECKCPSDENQTTEQVYPTITNGYTDLYKQTVESVVMVKVQRKSNGEVKATGSGVVILEQGDFAYIATNAHVIKDMTNDFEVEVFFSDSKGFLSGKSEIATISGKDFNEDVAILEINKSTKYKLATIGNSSTIEKGDFVYTIGSPFQKFNHTTAGYISNYNVRIDIDMINSGVLTPIYAILFDAPINNGNSGGALFDEEGKLIGITTLKYDEMDGIYGALPINHYMKVAKHLISTGSKYVRPSLSLTLLSINEMGSLRENYDISDDIISGVYVQNSLEPNIASQSIITEINGVDVYSNTDLQIEILKYKVGDSVTLTLINRDGLNNRQISVTLHE